MIFKSEWITTYDFINLEPLDVFHKENVCVEINDSPFKNYHTLFRKRFVLDNTEKITVRISADDYYKLYINGEFVCQGPAPAYPQNYKYNEVDISSFVKKGENVIAVHVYYQGTINRVWISGDNRQGMIADVYGKNGFLFGTDETWRCCKLEEFSGETTGYETTYLENIDFRKKERNRKNLEFDDSHYRNALCRRNADYCFCRVPAVNVDVYKKAPRNVERIEKGKYFVDFGEEITGQFYMKIRGKEGQKVRILCGEETQDSLYARYDMRCNCKYDETCILSGDEDEFEFFDYKTFRYVNVFTTEDIETQSFCAVVRHHPFKDIITVESRVPYVEDIWKICRNGVKYAAQEALLDCPSREKGVYLGDFTVSGLSHMYLTGDSEYYKKILYDFADTVNVCKGIMAVANCSLMQEIADFSLQYPMQLVNYYKYTGDTETVKALYPVAKGIIEYFKQFERADGLVENVKDKWNLVDWPMNLRDDYDAVIGKEDEILDCHNVLNSFYIGSLEALNYLSEILGYETTHTQSRKASFVKAFYNHETGLFCDNENLTHSSLHSNVLPLCFGIATEKMQQTLRGYIMKKGLACGVQFSYFVLKALSKIGAYREELELIVNESEHSWVNMLREGATTCYEAWGKEQKWNTSLCHPWASAPVVAIVEDLDGKFGIKVNECR